MIALQNDPMIKSNIDKTKNQLNTIQILIIDSFNFDRQKIFKIILISCCIDYIFDN